MHACFSPCSLCVCCLCARAACGTPNPQPRSQRGRTKVTCSNTPRGAQQGHRMQATLRCAAAGSAQQARRPEHTHSETHARRAAGLPCPGGPHLQQLEESVNAECPSVLSSARPGVFTCIMGGPTCLIIRSVWHHHLHHVRRRHDPQHQQACTLASLAAAVQHVWRGSSDRKACTILVGRIPAACVRAACARDEV